MRTKIKERPAFGIRIVNKGGGYIESTSTEANLLFAILEKLEEIRCGLIDIEDKVDNSESKYLNKVA